MEDMLEQVICTVVGEYLGETPTERSSNLISPTSSAANTSEKLK
jgi:hypothetical protein